MADHKFSSQDLKALQFNLADIKDLNDLVTGLITDQPSDSLVHVTLKKGNDEVKVKGIKELESILLQFDDWQKPERVDISFYYYEGYSRRTSVIGESKSRSVTVNIYKDDCFVYISGDSASWVYRTRDEVMAFLKSKQIPQFKRIVRNIYPGLGFISGIMVGAQVWAFGLFSAIANKMLYGVGLMFVGVGIIIFSAPLMSSFSSRLPGKNRIDFTLLKQATRTHVL